MTEITNEQWWKLYKTLPSELKGAVISAENADHVFEIADHNKVEEIKIPHLATIIDSVLMGFLLPGDFQGTIEKELKLEKAVAKKVSQEVNRLIFFPVKESLNQLHQKETTPATKAGESLPAPPSQETPPSPPKEDTYRESIE